MAMSVGSFLSIALSPHHIALLQTKTFCVGSDGFVSMTLSSLDIPMHFNQLLCPTVTNDNELSS